MKIKKFIFTLSALRTIFGPGLKHWEVTKNALPEDAELVRISVNERESSADKISLFFISKSFPDLPEGTSLEGEIISIRECFGPFGK